jgi:uncharacterized protein YceH (UPF0502 family)
VVEAATTDEVETKNGARRLSEAAAFRARVEERLKALESEIAEIKTRINGLLFFIAGTVIAQALLRLLA